MSIGQPRYSGSTGPKAGFDRIEACPKLIGQTADGPAFSHTRSELAGIAEFQLQEAAPTSEKPCATEENDWKSDGQNGGVSDDSSDAICSGYW